MQEIFLGVNVDHVATLRQARGTIYPDPIFAALLAEEAGADGITVHLREDRRHIQDRDIFALQERLQIPLNLEMAATLEMLKIAKELSPPKCCLVPERREELTTEGGLDVLKQFNAIRQICQELAASGIEVSLFIDPSKEQIDAAVKVGAPVIEIHTGEYAELKHPIERLNALQRIQKASEYAHQAGLIVNAGHGLHYHNVQAIAAIPVLHELNIGHSIVARAVMTGLPEAVRSMKSLMQEARRFTYG